LRPSLVDLECATAEILAIQAVDRSAGFRVGRHLDEAEALALARVTVGNDLDRLDLAELCKLLLQLVFGDLERQIADIQLLSHKASVERH
jgi:hypothetical protein